MARLVSIESQHTPQVRGCGCGAPNERAWLESCVCEHPHSTQLRIIVFRTRTMLYTVVLPRGCERARDCERAVGERRRRGPRGRIPYSLREV